MSESNVFKFKQFDILQDNAAMKVNTDGVLLGAWTDLTAKHTALDIGTGTGVIAIMLAQRKLDMMVTALEIDEAAYLDAKNNMENCAFNSRLKVLNISLQDFAMVHHERFDLIISNPPFFSGGTFSLNENKANVRHTIKLSHSDLLFAVKKLLHPEGHFDVILPYIEGLRFIEMSAKYDLYPHLITQVRSKEHKNIERLMLRLGLNKRSNKK
ncbi:MAG: methyltransferase [Saprospiraceae bacterium]|nr:methyltransferase [Saprospiraceae bacterium]